MRIAMMLWGLVGCLEAPGVPFADAGLRDGECAYPNEDEGPVQIQAGCVDDLCNAVRLQTSALGVGLDWTVDGEPWAEAECGIEIEPVVGKPVTIVARGGGRSYTIVVLATHLTGEETGGKDIIISGNGDDCMFWIVGLGNCLTQGSPLVYKSDIYDGSTWRGPEWVHYTTSPRYPQNFSYGDFFRWTPNGNGDPGVLSQDTPPTNALGHEFSVEHWFQLQSGETRVVFAGHSYNGLFQYVNDFTCVNGTGSIGGEP